MNRPAPAMHQRRALLAACLACALHPARAQPTSARALRIVVPAGPGSVPDVRARWLAERLGVELARPVLVENRPGAGGNLAMEAVARSEPDGQTMVMTHVGLMVFNPLLYERLGYDARRDFTPLTRVGVGPMLLLVRPASPHASLGELLARARREPRSQSFASQGIGTPPHLAAELLQQQAGITAVHVPYTNPAQPVADLLAGQIDWLFEGTPVALPLVRGGRLRALAVTAPERLNELPEVPTMAEAGLPSMNFEGWTGLALPAATPPAVVDALYAAVARVLASDEARQWFASVGNRPGGETPQQLAELVRAELQRWGAVLAAAGLRGSR
ncbi:MAG: tripartite tricarboxylate transporter substrate binding protein [Rubrivivax sp.]|nr:tripartite tricarboxylate transporter substrate binding protein [Rubrivivax sp.]